MHFTQGVRWHTMTIGINWQRGLLATWRTQMLGSASLAYHDHRGINWHLSWIASNVKNSNAPWCASLASFSPRYLDKLGAQGESIRRRNMENGTRYHVLANSKGNGQRSNRCLDQRSNRWVECCDRIAVSDPIAVRFSAIQSLSTHFRRYMHATHSIFMSNCIKDLKRKNGGVADLTVSDD